MTFYILKTLAEKHAKLLDYNHSLSGARSSDPEAMDIFNKLRTFKEELIIKNDFRRSEIESKLPELEMSKEDIKMFKSSIDFAKMGMIEDYSLEELTAIIHRGSK